MDYFLATSNKQLGICLRMLYAEGIQGFVETVQSPKGKIEFHVRLNATKANFEMLDARYKILIS